MDELLQIKCPFCGAILKVKNMPGIESKSVTCPVCKQKFPFKEFGRVEVPPVPPVVPGGRKGGSKHDEPTTYQYPGGGKPKQETVFVGGKNLQVGVLVNQAGGQEYRLKPGRNVIGRKASQSKADICIDTGGARSMSREHLVVDVKNVPAKGYVHYVSLYKEKVNKTMVGSEELMYGDCMVLEEGDIIRLPDAELKFMLPDEEQTLI